MSNADCVPDPELQKIFEEWIFSKGIYVATKDHKGRYSSPYTAAAFDGWCNAYLGRATPASPSRAEVIEECAKIFDVKAAANKVSWDNCASDGHRNANHWRDAMFAAQSTAACIRALTSKPDGEK